MEFEAAVCSSVHVRIVLEGADHRGIDVEDEIHLARFDGADGGHGFLRHGDAQALGLGLAGIPVVRVLLQDAHGRVGGELLLHEGTGAVLMQNQRLMGRPIRHDIGEFVGDQDGQLDHRLLGGEGDRIGIGRLDAVGIEEGQHRLRAAAELRIEHALEGIDHVGGGEILAAVELHALAQMEGPGQPVIRHRPVGRQLRQDLEIVVDIDQAVVDGEGVIGIVAGVHVGGIHRLLLAAPLIAQDLHAIVARGGPDRRTGERRGAGERDRRNPSRHFHCV